MLSEGVGGQDQQGVQRQGDLGPSWGSQIRYEEGRHSAGVQRDHCFAKGGWQSSLGW